MAFSPAMKASESAGEQKDVNKIVVSIFLILCNCITFKILFGSQSLLDSKNLSKKVSLC